MSPICGLPFFSVAFYWLDGLYFVISISMGIPQLERLEREVLSQSLEAWERGKGEERQDYSCPPSVIVQLKLSMMLCLSPATPALY